GDHRTSPQENWAGNAFLNNLVAGSKYLIVFTLGENDSLRRGLGAVAQVLHEPGGARQPARKFVAVYVKINLNPRYPTTHGSFRHCGRHPDENARIEG